MVYFTVQERRGRSPATTSSRPATARTSPPCSLTGSRSQQIHYLLEQYYLLHDCRLRPGSWTWRRAGSGTARSSPWPGSRRPRRQKLSHNIVLLILATLHNQDIMYNVLYIQCNTFALIYSCDRMSWPVTASCPAHLLWTLEPNEAKISAIV